MAITTTRWIYSVQTVGTDSAQIAQRGELERKNLAHLVINLLSPSQDNMGDRGLLETVGSPNTIFHQHAWRSMSGRGGSYSGS